MRILSLLTIVACTLGTVAYGQTTLINATFEEGMDGAAMANGATNPWVRGTAAALSGNFGLYISNNGGTSNAYSTGTAQVCHAFWTVDFPADQPSILLTFNWRAVGETGYDFMRVYAATSDPVSGLFPSGATNLGEFRGQSSWQAATIALSPAYAGQTSIRIIFTWRNDASLGGQPPAAIDNVQLTAQVAPVGASCNDPIPIASFPYTYTGNTANLLNFYGSQSCSSNYGGGNDAVFRLELPAPGTATITVQNLSQTGYIGWFLKSETGCTNTSASLDCAVSGSGNTASKSYVFPPGVYYIVVDYYASPLHSEFKLDVVFNELAFNDECWLPEVLIPTLDCEPRQGTVAGATASSGVPACTGTPNNDVWYEFTATNNAHDVVVAGSSGFDAVVQAFSGACGTLTSIGCRNNTGTGGTETLRVTGLTVGQAYRLRVYHFATAAPATPDFSICVKTAAPDNDRCDRAPWLTPSATCSNVSGTVAYATASAEASVCFGNPNDDVWYRFVASATGHTVTVTGHTGFDPVVQAYSGTCGNFVSVGCIDATGTGGNETLTLTGLTIGETYYIRLFHYYENTPVTGTFSICVRATSTISTCDNPYVVNSFPFTGSGNTSGTGNNYGSQSCATSYGGGNDAVYLLNIPAAGRYNVTVTNTSGSAGWIGWFLKDETGCANTGSSLVCATSSSGSSATGYFNACGPGVYYLVIDYFPSPISSAYSLSVTPVDLVEGASCCRPRQRTAPFNETGTTCGADNNYGLQCGTDYGAGQDYIYRINIPTPGEYNFTLHNTSGTGNVIAALKTECDGACLANFVSGVNNTAQGTYNFAAPGAYLLVLDSKPGPNCYNFNLIVQGGQAQDLFVWPGDANHDGVVDSDDFFLAAAGYGLGGVARQQPGSAWQAYLAENLWPGQIAYKQGHVNHLYLDANGDGSVNLFDVALTVLHRGRTW